jgi:carbamoyltransferase
LTADEYGARAFGSATFAAFDPHDGRHRACASALHDRLSGEGFGARTAAALFGLGEISDVRANRAAYYDAFVLPRTAAGDAARFFVLHEVLAPEALRAWLGAELIAFLAEMGAIAEAEGGWRSVVSATWLEGRLVFADARAYNVVWPGEPYPDYVMPPGGDSVGLARVAPRLRRRSTLDLCCGAGAQALTAAGYSDTVAGVDLSPRALRFARFNAAANRIENAAFVQGDCYEPLGDARFDAIVANPPFVPWPEDDALLYRGGGPFGDDVVGRILAGSVERLAPQGALTIVGDIANVETLPERIRGWQGTSRRTVILVQNRYTLIDYAERHAAHLDGPAREAAVLRLMRHFADHEIATLDFGFIVQRNEPGPTEVVPTAAAGLASIATAVAKWFEA